MVDMFKPMRSIEDRMPGIIGSRRWQRIIDLYANGGREMKVMFFPKCPGGEGKLDFKDSLLGRHHLNTRRQVSVVRRYSAGVLKEGVLQSMRGQLIAVESNEGEDGKAGRYEFIAGATLVEACYVAIKITEDSKTDNPYVKDWNLCNLRT